MTIDPTANLPAEDEPAGQLTIDEHALANFEGSVPRHVAIIMDGNGRWAQQRGMRRIRGHHAGAQSVRRIVEACRYLGVEVLTLYAFSEQNWSRPQDEVSGLMTLFDFYIKRERVRLEKNGVRMRVIGDRDKLSKRLRGAIQNLENYTAHNDKLLLQVAVSYGGREEILRASQKLAQAVADGELRPSDITEEAFEQYLFTSGTPDPDLIIRTSGEMRISNFLLWQLAYSEIHVTDVLWPDFDEREFVRAMESFSRRERRFGKTGAQIQEDET